MAGKASKKKDAALDDLLSDIEHNNDVLKDAMAQSEKGAGSVKEENLEVLIKTLEETQNNLRRALDILSSKKVNVSALRTRVSAGLAPSVHPSEADRVIEGVFNGESMVGSDGREYSIPPNYASKSKLVEGDILKLTITKNGSFIYKQIGPIEREKLKAVLLQDEITGDWYAIADSRRWKLLTASVTYFRGLPGDEVVILIPKSSKSLWAAVENIIKN